MISLYIPDANVTRGILIWTKGNFGGVKFAERMHEAWVQHLGFKPRTEMRAFRDQFGRRVSSLANVSMWNVSALPPAPQCG